MPKYNSETAPGRRAFVVCLRNSGYRQADIAKRLGVSRSRISAIEMRERYQIERRLKELPMNLGIVEDRLVMRSLLSGERPETAEVKTGGRVDKE